MPLSNKSKTPFASAKKATIPRSTVSLRETSNKKQKATPEASATPSIPRSTVSLQETSSKKQKITPKASATPSISRSTVSPPESSSKKQKATPKASATPSISRSTVSPPEISTKKATDPNYTEKEDEWLCSAFINESCSSTAGNDRKSERFFKAIKVLFEFLKASAPALDQLGVENVDREWSSLRSRFLRIQKEYNHWLPSYRKILKEKKSGYVLSQYIDLAIMEFENKKENEEKKIKFKWKHVVPILQKLPNENPLSKKRLVPDRDHDANDEGEEEREDVGEDGDDDGDKKPKAKPAINEMCDVQGTGMTRPIASKAAKKAENNGTKKKTSKEDLNILVTGLETQIGTLITSVREGFKDRTNQETRTEDDEQKKMQLQLNKQKLLIQQINLFKSVGDKTAQAKSLEMLKKLMFSEDSESCAASEIEIHDKDEEAFPLAYVTTPTNPVQEKDDISFSSSDGEAEEEEEASGTDVEEEASGTDEDEEASEIVPRTLFHTVTDLLELERTRILLNCTFWPIHKN